MTELFFFNVLYNITVALNLFLFTITRNNIKPWEINKALMLLMSLFVI